MTRFTKFAERKYLLIALLAMTPLSAALAATDTTTFTVSAAILSDCNLTATNLTFGTYDPAAGSATDATSTVTAYCSTGLPYSLALNVGTGGGNYTARTLISGIDTLNFNLYTSAGRTTVWGDGTGSTATIGGTGAGILTPSSHTVYGRVASGQSSAVGAYGSVITVTVTF